MRYIYFSLCIFFVNQVSLATPKHIKKNSEEKKEKAITIVKEQPHLKRYELCKHDPNYVIVSGHKVQKKIVFFKEIELISCFDFIETIVDEFYLCDDIEEIKAELLQKNPEDLWYIFHKAEIFDTVLAITLDKIYTKEEFILIYEAKLAIEFLLYVLDHTGKTKYHYTHGSKLTLKELMHKILRFITEKEEILQEVLTKKDMIELKRFFDKYSKVTNNFTFLNELQELIKILSHFGIETSGTTGARQKLSIFTRFNNYF